MHHTMAEVTVAVKEHYKDRISEVVRNLQSAGMNVERSMEQLGLITGSIDPKKVKALSQVEGVLHVESAREFQLPPPESDIQ
jgi:hypothetical protein